MKNVKSMPQKTAIDSKDPMVQLQSKLYNVLTSSGGLDLNPKIFQIMQTAEPLPTTSEGIWSIFNNLPPESLTGNFNSAAINNFYDTYKGVIVTIIPQKSAEFRNALGDKYVEWDDYKKTLTPKAAKEAGGMINVYTDWADVALDPGVASRTIALFRQFQNGVVPVALDKVLDPLNVDSNFGPIFSKNIEDLRTALLSAPSKSVSFDSATESSDTSRTWAKGEASGLYSFFSGGASGEWEKISKEAASNRVTLEISFDHLTTFTAAPGGWYDTSALNLAYKTNDNTVWPAGQSPTWDTTFGENGNFKRMATGLVAFDGMTMTMKSWTKYSKEDQETIEASANIGFWPFFSASASGGSHTKTTFDSNGYMEVTTQSPKGNPAILGVNVTTLEDLLTFVGMYDKKYELSLAY